MRDIQTFFKYGLDRYIPPLATYQMTDRARAMPQINLGPGKKKQIPGTCGVGKGPQADFDWWAPEPLPFADGSVGQVHAYQFMEHLSADDAIAVLRECERVLAPTGVMHIVTPYANSQHQFQALDHKSFWTEETWDWMFGNDYYDDHEGEGWKLSVHCCFIMGIVYRNLDLFTQLVKSNGQ